MRAAEVDLIRWTVVWVGAGAVGLGVALALLPPVVTAGPAYTHLHELSAGQWAVIWVALGAATITTALVRWTAALWPLLALSCLLTLWSASFAWAAVHDRDHGRGTVGAIVWIWMAGLVLFAARRAAITPHLDWP